MNRRLQQGQRVRRIEQIFKWIVFEVLIRREIRIVIDVSVHAAANVTTEQANYQWLVAQTIVERLTARHAAPKPTTGVM